MLKMKFLEMILKNRTNKINYHILSESQRRDDLEIGDQISVGDEEGIVIASRYAEKPCFPRKMQILMLSDY